MSSTSLNPPRNGEGDRLETVEGPVEAELELTALSLSPLAPSVSLRDPPPRSGEELV